MADTAPSIADRLGVLGKSLEVFKGPPGPLVPVVLHNGVAWVSGMPPAKGGVIQYKGAVGSAVSVEDGYEAAGLCVLNLLGQLEVALGSLDRIERIIKVVGFVSCAGGFALQSKVINGASDLLVEIFGQERGSHARSAIGVASLPGDMSVEVELVVAYGPAAAGAPA